MRRQALPAPLRRDLLRVLRSGAGDTPRRFLLPEYAASQFREAARAASRVKASPRVVLAYSIKTNPFPGLLDLARAHGMRAEAITQAEVAHALRRGFRMEDTVLNGPAKWWPEPVRETGYAAIFCDSLQELRALRGALAAGRVRARSVGLRLRPATVRSRFGVDLSERKSFAEAVRLLRSLPRDQEIGFHFHQASSAVGVRTWQYLARNFIAAAGILGEHAGRPPAALSVGGGWHPDDWSRFLRAELGDLARLCRRQIPSLRELIVEPGKALAQRSMGLVMRVLEVRRGELLVDGSVAELPDLPSHPHRFVSLKAGKLASWPSGRTRLLGRLCMEFDVVGEALHPPAGLRAGDLVAVLDCGAYDASMAYLFSRGFVEALPGPGTL
ncbi:MAG TPA: hypothetical protein VFB08_05860 [Burkholderiales bacterium]|nr:hypothetical protein [Burkholderiales bacterium]